MAWKDHKKWHGGKAEQLAAGQPIRRPSTEPGPLADRAARGSSGIPVPDPNPPERVFEGANRPPQVPQGNFIATISVSPAIMASRNLTADSLQVALDSALQTVVRFEKTISVSVVVAPPK
jgi:hypothetical protein